MAKRIARDYAGQENCTEILNDTRPDIVRTIHQGYLQAGADMVQTNSFGGSPLTSVTVSGTVSSICAPAHVHEPPGSWR